MSEEIEINSRFDTSDFNNEIADILKDVGYIEYVKGEQTPMGYQLPGWRIKRPFKIVIKLE